MATYITPRKQDEHTLAWMAYNSYLLAGGKVTVYPASKAPVCVPVPAEPRRKVRLSAVPTLSLAEILAALRFDSRFYSVR